MRTWDAIVSVDLAQRHDFTAIAVAAPLVWAQRHEEGRVGAYGLEPDMLEGVVQQHGEGWLSPLDLTPGQLETVRRAGDRWPWPSRPPLVVGYLDRVRGENYVRVGDRIERLMSSFAAHLDVQLIVDSGGVGRGVVDQLSARGLYPASITATAGDRVNGPWPDVRVPKRELVSSTQLALSAGLLRIAAELPLAQALVDELVAYEVHISPGGHDSYEPRSGKGFDDLCYAACQLTWAFYWYHENVIAADEAARRRPPVPIR